MSHVKILLLLLLFLLLLLLFALKKWRFSEPRPITSNQNSFLCHAMFRSAPGTAPLEVASGAAGSWEGKQPTNNQQPTNNKQQTNKQRNKETNKQNKTKQANKQNKTKQNNQPTKQGSKQLQINHHNHNQLQL